MRRFPLRLFILIAVITALAGSSLAVQQIDLSVGGVSLKRGDDTLLGLQQQGGDAPLHQRVGGAESGEPPADNDDPLGAQLRGSLLDARRPLRVVSSTHSVGELPDIYSNG